MWSSANAYEAFMARWSRAVAAQFVAWLDVGPNKAWLDVGCGTGALTQTILDTDPSRVVGIEPSQAFVERARAAVPDGRVSFIQNDASGLERLGQFDAVVSGLVLNFLPDVPAAVVEMTRATSPGGTLAAYVWDYAAGMQMTRYFWTVAAELDADAARFDEGRRMTICNPEALLELFGRHLTEVEVQGFIIPTRFASFDDYWRPFLGGVGSAPAYAMSLEEEQRERLRHDLQERLPVQSDGSLNLQARAWAVKGRRA
jgi:trans-aconitate methyltransferase